MALVNLPPEQRELEVLRRLADVVRDMYRDSAGVFSLRTQRIEKWHESDVPSILKSLAVIQGWKENFGKNWETSPSDDVGVFMLDGHRVKIVPVEPTERMVNDDNAADPPTLHPFGSLDAETIRYVYKQLIRVAPAFPVADELLTNRTR